VIRRNGPRGDKDWVGRPRWSHITHGRAGSVGIPPIRLSRRFTVAGKVHDNSAPTMGSALRNGLCAEVAAAGSEGIQSMRVSSGSRQGDTSGSGGLGGNSD